MENINEEIMETTKEVMDDVTITDMVEDSTESGFGTVAKVGLVIALAGAAFVGGKWIYNKIKAKKNESEGDVEGDIISEETVEDDSFDEENE